MTRLPLALQPAVLLVSIDGSQVADSFFPTDSGKAFNLSQGSQFSTALLCKGPMTSQKSTEDSEANLDEIWEDIRQAVYRWANYPVFGVWIL